MSKSYSVMDISYMFHDGTIESDYESKPVPRHQVIKEREIRYFIGEESAYL